MLVQVQQLLCIFSVPNNRGKFACRKNRFSIVSLLYEKGKTICKELSFQSGTGIFTATLTCNLLESLMDQLVCICLCSFMNPEGHKGGIE